MNDINKATLSDRSEEDITAAKDLDDKGTSAGVDEAVVNIIDSAQKSLEESRIRIKNTPVEKKEENKIDYETFILPEEKDKYLAHVNQKNRKIHSEKILELDGGALKLHLFSIVTTLI